MRRMARFPALLLILAILAPGFAAAQQYPDEPGDGIADLAKVLTAADADSIRSTLYRLRDRAGVEVRLLTVQNVAGFGTGDATPEAFATGVYNAWKLGYGQERDGVLVLLSVDDRVTRIELGDGVPAAQDAAIRAVVDDVMMPRFRGGDMTGGLREGIVAVAESFGAATLPDPPVRAPAPAAPLPRPQPAYTPPAAPSNPYEIPLNTGVIPFMGVLVALAGCVGLMVLVAGTRPKCPQCLGATQRLKGAAAAARLEAGQRREQALGSVRYAVRHCPRCQHHVVRGTPSRMRRRESCPECSYQTLRVDRETVEFPTYDHGGARRVERECGHCGWRQEETVALPRSDRGSEVDLRTVLRIATVVADITRLADGSRRQDDDGSHAGESRGGDSDGSSGGHSSGRGASGRW
jgi:uncharacterized protein